MATFKRLLSRAVVNTPVTVGSYTVGGGVSTTIIGLVVANTYGTAIKVKIYIFDGVNNTHIVFNADIPPGSSLVAVGGDQKIVLQTGDSVRVVTDGASNTCDVVMSVLEV